MIRRIPLGAKIISIVYYVFAVLLLLAGIFFIFGFGDRIVDLSFIGLLAILVTEFPIVTGIILAGVSVMVALIAHGLWKAEKWAYIFALLIAAIRILGTFTLMVGGDIANNLGSFLINIVIVGYLLIHPRVRRVYLSRAMQYSQ